MLRIFGLWWEAASAAGPPDTESPVGTITSPLTGAIVAGTIDIVGSFTDNVGVTDGRRVTDSVSASYSGQSGGSFTISVDTTLLSEGDHTFQIDAIDAAGNHGFSQIITLNVDNIPNPTPAPANKMFIGMLLKPGSLMDV